MSDKIQVSANKTLNVVGIPYAADTIEVSIEMDVPAEMTQEMRKEQTEEISNALQQLIDSWLPTIACDSN